MEEILKILDTKGEMKRNELYGLLKTKSKKINSEISKKIKSFNNIGDFFSHYSKQNPLFELLNEVKLYSSKNYDEMFLSFDSNIEQYISCLSEIIISIKLILKAQEILKKVYLSSKQYLLKLKIKNQIENISQENLFFFIENFLHFSENKTPKSFSNSSSILSFSSCDSINNNLLYHQNFLDIQSLKKFSSVDIEKTLKILYEEPCTPAFGSKTNKNFENQKKERKESSQNICLRKSSSLTLSGEKEINTFKDNKIIVKNKRNSSIPQKVLNNNTNEKKYENLLKMINNIYRKGIINSEEKIRLKKLVIAKSKKLDNLYNNNYRNKFIDENVLKTEITKLMNSINSI